MEFGSLGDSSRSIRLPAFFSNTYGSGDQHKNVTIPTIRRRTCEAARATYAVCSTASVTWSLPLRHITPVPPPSRDMAACRPMHKRRNTCATSWRAIDSLKTTTAKVLNSEISR